MGNRESVQTTPASGSIVTDTYGTANAVNQYAAISGQSVTYDTNGNLTATRLQAADSGPVSTMAYDSSNRLLSVTNGTDSVTSTYDTRNRVTSRTINGVTTLFLWDGWNLIEERDPSGTQTRRYVHGAAVDEILLMVDATGAKYHLHDALGSVTALTDSTGAILESYQYDVFGKLSFFDATGSAQSASSVDNRFLYTGREWIAEASLYDYRNRVYSPVIGRFMQIDPIRFSAGDVNMYRYVGNSISRYKDAFGLEVEATFDISSGKMALEDEDTHDVCKVKGSSGTGKAKDANKQDAGHVPPGKYKIYPRPDSDPKNRATLRLAANPLTFLTQWTASLAMTLKIHQANQGTLGMGFVFTLKEQEPAKDRTGVLS